MIKNSIFININRKNYSNTLAHTNTTPRHSQWQQLNRIIFKRSADMNFLRVTLIFIILITCNIIFFTCSAFTLGSFAEIHMKRIRFSIILFLFRFCFCFLFLSEIDIFTSILMFVVVMAIIRKLVCNILAQKTRVMFCCCVYLLLVVEVVVNGVVF